MDRLLDDSGVGLLVRLQCCKEVALVVDFEHAVCSDWYCNFEEELAVMHL